MSDGVWPPLLVRGLQQAREFVREALDAQRAGVRFSDTRVFQLADVRSSIVYTGGPRAFERLSAIVGQPLFGAVPFGPVQVPVAGGPVTVSITVPFVRVKFNEESYGLGIEEAAALAGVAPARPAVPPPTPERVAPMVTAREPEVGLRVFEFGVSGVER